ncbi:MAG: hypothetical protein HYZ25_18710 [Chloroflexi bacterium]|nr:hypothetical protein [Chloroflexota bacterium]
MKSDKNKQNWGERATDWITLLLILFGIIFGSSIALGLPLSGIDTINRKIVRSYHCPGAIDITEKRGPITQVGSDPNSFGQTVEGICTFADGSTKVVSNDAYAVTTIVGSLGLGAILGVGIAVIFTPIYILWRKKAIKVT